MITEYFKKKKELILIVSFKETHEWWVEIQDTLVTYQR